MSNAYCELMQKVELSDEMRRRILENVDHADLTAPPKVVRFPNLRRYAALAACLAVVVVGIFAYPTLMSKKPAVDAPATSQATPVQGTSGITECGSAQELSDAVGFSVPEVTSLPFTVADSTYCDYGGTLAEITYTGAEGQCAIYRMSAGTEDNSGDYNTYDSVEKIKIGTLTAELKGSQSGYTLACWTDGIYAYSLSLSDCLDAAGWADMLNSIK